MDVSRHIYDVVHSMMQRLRPGALDDLGLEDALEDEIETWQKRNPGTSATLTTSGELAGLGERINISIYRIVQECLTNIARHAAASHVSIDLDNRGGQLELRVSDDGRGMDMTGITGGLGLIGMRERVEALGGSFLLESGPGKGVRIMASMPATTNADNV
jgi:signal transduction histidine kinase